MTIDPKENCPLDGYCVSCNTAEPSVSDSIGAALSNIAEGNGLVVTHDAAPTEAPVIVHDARDPIQGFDMRLKGVGGTAFRLDLAESQLFLATALTADLIRRNFLAGETVEVGAQLFDGETVYFLELTLGERGFEIEDLAATNGRDVVLMELVAEIVSYRYLRAETTV